jgi:prepilin-type N-terminal cleavage/methylation domain-containing protein
MLSAPPSAGPPATDRQAGFTLVELLVAILMGIVVLFALTEIMIVTLHQTQHVFTRVDATRQARTAVAYIENELHSACIDGDLAPPIQPGSNGSNLIFTSYVGTAANPTPIWHQLTFSATAGTLTDTSYTVTGASPNWNQGTQVGVPRTVLSNVAQQSASVPMFQYYAYQQESSDSTGSYWVIPDGSNIVPITNATPNTPLVPGTTGLSQTDANNAVEVAINMSVGATNSSLNGRATTANNDSVTDSISLRLTTPPNEVDTGASAQGYGPCE